MKFIYLNILILLIIFASPASGADFREWSPSFANEGIQLASSQINEKKYINISGLLNITAVPLSNEPHRKEGVFVIGEVALSQAAKDLERLSEEGKHGELVEIGELTGLYSEMSSAFAIGKIPIKLTKFESQEKKSFMDYNFNNEQINATSQDNFEQTPPILPQYEIFEGRKESAGGVDVIWDY